MTTSAQLYLRLLGYVRPHWRVMAGTVVALVLTGLLEPAMPALMKPLVDESLIARDASAILWVPLALLGVFVLKGIAEYVSAVSSQWVAARVISDLRNEMFRRMLDIPLARQHALGSATLLSRVTYDVAQLGSALSQAWVIVLRDVTIIVGLVAFLLWSSWQLTLMILLIGPFAAAIIHWASHRMRGSSQAIQKSMGETTRILDEALGARREISIFHGQRHETDRFAQAVEQTRQQTMAVVRVASANVPFVQTVAAVAVVGVIFVATTLTQRDLLTPGELVAYITALAMIFEPIRRLTKVNETLQRGIAAAESVFALIDEPGEPDPGQETLADFSGHLSLQAVRFAYPGAEQPAIASVTLDIPAGSTLALVGASGSGKSTLVDLLGRFIHPASGVILADGQDIRQLRLDHWRAQIALVSQQVVLFDDTLAANIAYGEPAPDLARVEAAARAAHAWDFIQALPEGLQTRAGESGARLSGGQRQRLALARAFYKDARVIILDEATSALDSETEQAVTAVLREIHGKVTVILVAHRLTTIRHADRIAVMEAGEVVESGTHDQLLALNGRYARLAQPAPVC